eukprot:4123611-Prymnesium_polylepis.1
MGRALPCGAGGGTHATQDGGVADQCDQRRSGARDGRSDAHWPARRRDAPAAGLPRGGGRVAGRAECGAAATAHVRQAARGAAAADGHRAVCRQGP